MWLKKIQYSMNYLFKIVIDLYYMILYSKFSFSQDMQLYVMNGMLSV